MSRHTQLTDWLRQWKGAPEARAKLMRALKEPYSLHALVELAGKAAPTNLEAVLAAGRNGWERALPVMRVVSWPEGEIDRLRDLLGRTMVGARVASTELPEARSDLAGRFLHRYLPVANAPLQGAMFLWSWLVDSALDWNEEEVATGIRGSYSLASFISGIPSHTTAAVTDNLLGDPHVLMPPAELTQALALLGRRVLRWDGIRYVPVWGRVNRVLFDKGGTPAGGGQQLVVTGTTGLATALKKLLGPRGIKAKSDDALKLLYNALDALPAMDDLVPGARHITINQLVQGIDYAKGRSSGTVILELRKLNGAQLVDLIVKMWDDGARTIADIAPRLRALLVTQPSHQMPLGI